MHIASTFAVPAEPEPIFDAFLDPTVMRRCITGCEELERLSESRFRGKLSSEVAHVRFRVGFDVDVVEMDRPRFVRAVLSGEDRRLGSSLKLDALLAVEPNGESSTVSYQMELAIWGKLGRLGEPIIRRRSAEVERDFVQALLATFDGSLAAESDGTPSLEGRGEVAGTEGIAPPPAAAAVAGLEGPPTAPVVGTRRASASPVLDRWPRARHGLLQCMLELRKLLDRLIERLK